MILCPAFQEQRISAGVEGAGAGVVFDRRLPPAPSPPTHSRLPPDGHEFPASYADSTSDKSARFTSPRSHSRSRSRDGRDLASITTCTSTGGSSSLTRTSSLSSRWRRQDEKSEKSVRDKIAMFSQNKRAKKQDESDPQDDGADIIEGGMRGYSETDISSHGGSPRPSLSKTNTFSSMINVSSNNSQENGSKVKPAASEVDVCRNGRDKERSSPKPSRIDDNAGSEQGLHLRSQSLVDIERTHHGKRHSMGTFERPREKLEEKDRDRRCSVTNMMELRRKSLSKLRGLVIPESNSSETYSKPPIDLPRIGSSPPPLPTTTPVSVVQKTLSLPRDTNRVQKLYKADSISSIESCESNVSKQSSTISAQSWRSHISSSTVSKYSPVIKRKVSTMNRPDSLPPVSCRNTRSCSPAADISASPLRSNDGMITPSSDLSFEMECKQTVSKTNSASKSSGDSRLNRSEDSDNDSAVSSTLSSFSQSMTPPASPLPDGFDHDETRTIKAQARIRHSPQCSMDEMDPKRVLKTGTIEAENRRNVIKSAKCSSGRSSDEHSTPELTRKSVMKTDQNFALRLETDLRDSMARPGYKKLSSGDARHQSSEESLREKTIQQNDDGEHQICAEQIYIDNMGDMYKESEIKVAYLNEVSDDFEHMSMELPSSDIPSDVLAEVHLNGLTSETKETLSDDRWAQLEMKYGNSSDDFETKIGKLRSPEKPELSLRSTVNLRKHNTKNPPLTGGKGFKALAERWKQRAEVEEDLPSSPRLTSPIGSSNKPVEEPTSSVRELRPNSLSFVRADVPDRKLSMPEYGNAGIRLRDRRSEGNAGSSDIPSRPSSLIENSSEHIQNMEPETTYLSQSVTTASSSSDSLDCQGSISRTVSKEVLEAFSKIRTSGHYVSVGSRFGVNSSGPPKVSDITKAFEGRSSSISSHPRMISVDSTVSDDGSASGHYGSVTSLTSGTRDQYGSISSLASSTSIISSQELAQLIEEANQSLEESGTPCHEIVVVVLHREVASYGSVGLTLAGGADYDTREITVHKIIPGSLADRDGRIQRGDRVISINGKTLRGVTHREALAILKSPRPEVVLVLSRSRSVTPPDVANTSSYVMTSGNAAGDGDAPYCHRPAVFMNTVNHVASHRPPKILESPMDSKSLVSDIQVASVPRGPPFPISLLKDGAGLGFSLEGGKDSPLGDRPLTVKKIFAGGAADKGGILQVGDEILSINSVDVTTMARIEAWNYLKKLPDGKVNLVIRQKLSEGTETTGEISADKENCGVKNDKVENEAVDVKAA